MYVVRTSVDQSKLSASCAVERYKDLGAVEQAFRCFKTVDLKVRPVHHRLEGRVRAHVFLCMLAYRICPPLGNETAFHLLPLSDHSSGRLGKGETRNNHAK